MAININNEADLFSLMSSSNVGPGGAWPLSGDYVLTTNLNMSSYNCQSIGWTQSLLGNGFTGSFDGQNYTVTITNTDTTVGYSGFFCEVTSSSFIKNLTVNFLKPGGDIFTGNTGQVGGLVADCDASIIDNCHIEFGDNYSFGTVSVPINAASAGFIGSMNTPVTNCSLVCGNNFKIYAINRSAFFIATSNNNVQNCNITIGTDSLLSALQTGALFASSANTNQCSLTIGNNCTINALGNAAVIAPESTATVENCKVTFLGDCSITGGGQGVGTVGGYIFSSNINNCIVLFGENTYINGGTVPTGGVFGFLGPTATNCFAIYKNYSIIGNPARAIVGNQPSPNPSILAQSCGSPLVGSNVTNMSTTSLETIITYLQSIPYLQSLIPYIQQNYCYTPPPAPIEPPPCPCTAYLCNSNPQVTNYNESEDKSRKADQIVRSNYDVKLAEMQAGTRMQGVPIFKSYDEMMMWKQGACRYRR
jgi:hypothetical protein